MIDFGASNGSTEAGNYVRPYIKELYISFFENIEKDKDVYFKELDNFHIVFLVSGKHNDFKSEGPEGLKKVRGKKKIVIYYAIPQERWDGIDQASFRKYIGAAVSECFELLVKKAKSQSLIINESILYANFFDILKTFESVE